MHRTDDHRNPTAFTTDLAKQAGLIEGRDYAVGSPFSSAGSTFHTAKILADPLEVTSRLLDAVGFYTKSGNQRWIYIALPSFVWKVLNEEQRRDVIGFMYGHEGGTAMRGLFPFYGSR